MEQSYNMLMNIIREELKPYMKMVRPRENSICQLQKDIRRLMNMDPDFAYKYMDLQDNRDPCMEEKIDNKKLSYFEEAKPKS